MKSLQQIRFAIILLVAFTFSSSAFAWGPEGHKIVGEIAQKHMTKAAKDSFAKYLADTTVPQCASWLDAVRKQPEYAHTANWHYVNMEKGESYHASKDTNVITELYQMVDNLKHRDKHSKEEIAFNLKVLVHLVGDIHQPMHNGYGSDRGGNQILLKNYLGADTTRYGKPFNLHAIWDGDIIYTQKITTEKCLAKGATYNEVDRKKMTDADFVKWMEESRAYLSMAYDFKKEGIDQAYVDAATPTVEDQIYRAGIRLAHLMDEVFKK